MKTKIVQIVYFRVFGETKSRATVHLEPEGMITAKIETPEETYHIEPSWRHIADSDPETMIAYKESDINFRLGDIQ